MPDATWRVYLTEWLIIWTSDASGPEGMAECVEHFERKYRGRVRAGDRRVVPAITGRGGGTDGPYCLQLKLPNLRGEYKDREDAEKKSFLLYAKYAALVQRGSAEEQALLDYGKKMLPGAG
jgi:hypothetical protein